MLFGALNTPFLDNVVFEVVSCIKALKEEKDFENNLQTNFL